MAARPTGPDEAGGGSARNVRSAWQRLNNRRDFAEIQPPCVANGTAAHFRQHGQRIAWRAEWAHANCTVCGAPKALRVRTTGAFRCTRCGIKGGNLNQLRALERRALEARP
jgi:hypothetical protein